MHPALPTPQRTAGWVLLLAALLLAGPAAAEPLDIDQDHIGPRWLGTNYQDNLGWLVASSGDLNGDGLGDFAVTSPQDEGPVTFDSVVRLFFGRSSGAPGSGQADWANVEIRDGKVGTDAIFQLAFVPDVNGDGNPDIAVALPNAGTAGKAFVLPGGGTAWPVQITSSDSLITWTGYTQTENSDLSAETRPSDITGGDFDDDGLGDVVISSGLFQRVWVHYGVDGLGEYSLESLSTHFEECFEEAPGSNFGSAMASGDFNNDGYDDLAIGGPGCDGGNGQVFVRYGSAAGLSATPDLTLSDGDRLGGALIAGDRRHKRSPRPRAPLRQQPGPGQPPALPRRKQRAGDDSVPGHRRRLLRQALRSDGGDLARCEQPARRSA